MDIICLAPNVMNAGQDVRSVLQRVRARNVLMVIHIKDVMVLVTRSKTCALRVAGVRAAHAKRDTFYMKSLGYVVSVRLDVHHAFPITTVVQLVVNVSPDIAVQIIRGVKSVPMDVLLAHITPTTMPIHVLDAILVIIRLSTKSITTYMYVNIAPISSRIAPNVQNRNARNVLQASIWTLPVRLIVFHAVVLRTVRHVTKHLMHVLSVQAVSLRMGKDAQDAQQRLGIVIRAVRQRRFVKSARTIMF